MEVRIDGWRKGIRFSSAHLTADLGKCERLHGHTYALHAIVEGPQGENRIVMDFVEVVGHLRTIAEELDHRILVPMEGGRYEVDADDETVTMRFDGKAYSFPRGDCYELPAPSSTAEDLVQHVLEQFKDRATLPSGVSRVRIGVDEGYGQGAWVEWRVGEP